MTLTPEEVAALRAEAAKIEERIAQIEQRRQLEQVAGEDVARQVEIGRDLGRRWNNRNGRGRATR